MELSLKTRGFIIQLSAITRGEVKSRYRGTLLGVGWVVVNPIIFFAINWFVFHRNLGNSIPHYALYLVAGLLPWSFISNALGTKLNSLVYSRHLFFSLPLDPWLPILASVLELFVTFLIAFLGIILFIDPGTLLRLGVGLALVAASANLLCGVVLAVRTLTLVQVFLRDTQFILQFLNSIVYLSTPIFYSIDSIPLRFRWIQSWNPYYAFIAPFQVCLTSFSWSVFLPVIFHGLGFSLFLGVVSLLLWRWLGNEIYRVL